ncbi:autotransporter domain-containing protein [Pseudomonas cavernicola]|uniref:Autotransporter domain-containing protein n=1 Tax=Pseudomonas cavernicola TaxID=2320866 RepID=A0A418XNU4_9PSED|nr:autotransporter outer membrane beta-barrel domain-containing protein [Pseudomonas cavernicola]RJG14140.1 autotransporter domain-containing protein [Pseudomonas cavernicola]
MIIRFARKTPLALVIAANLSLSLTAQAQTYDLSQGAPLAFNTNQNQPLTFIGSASGNTDLIDFGGITVQGAVTNNAQLSASGPSNSAIDFDASTINGNVTNTANLSSSGNPASTLNFGMSRVQGDLINSGTISVTGIPDPADDETPNALLIWNSQITGKLHNTGSLIANGQDSFALKIENGSQIAHGIQNDGSIRATGQRATGLYVGDNSSVGEIISNQGTIEALGAGSRGIVLDQNTNNVIIVNGSTVRTEGVAIDILPGSHLSRLTHDGDLIEGGETAIRGAGVINWEGGTIRGKILDNFVINVLGKATFDGDYIQAKHLEISWDDYHPQQPEYQGYLQLQRPHTTLDGNLELLGAGATLEMLLSQATDPSRPVLDVSGNAEIEPGTRVLLTPKPNDFSTNGTQPYQLIRANSWERFDLTPNAPSNARVPVTIADINVQSSSALLQVQGYQLQGNTLIAQLQMQSGAAAADVIAGQGASQNAQAAIQPISEQLSQLSAQDPLFQTFANADVAQTTRLAEQLGPDVNGAVGKTAISNQNLLGNVLQGRSASLRQGLSSGDGLSETGAWVQVLNSDADQGERNGIPGYDADSQGIAVGADGKLNPQTTLGLAYSYLTSDVRSQTGKTDIEGHALTLYSGFEQGAWFVDAGLTYGRSDNQSKRYIAGTRAKGDYDSDLLGFNLLGGYGFDLGQGLLLEPRVAARYSNVLIDSFREKGSSAALAVNEQRFEVGELGAGVRLAGNFAAGQGSLEPEAKLMAYHDFIADQVSSTSAFVVGGTPFITNGAKPARDSYEASLGVTYHLGAVSVGVSYDYLTKTDFSADTLQARVRYDF